MVKTGQRLRSTNLVATITDMTFDVTKTSAKTGNDYTVHIVSYQPPPYDGQQKAPTTRDIFSSSDVGKELRNFSVGQSVNLTFVKNGKFSNLTAISAAGSAQAPAPQQGTTAPQAAPKQPYRENDNSTRIARAVAIKAAVDIKGNMAAADFKKADPVAMAKLYEPYLTMTEIELEGSVDSEDEPTDAPY
jgi:hypothetical protein